MADKQHRLLIVDDEIEVCEILKVLFQQDNFEVATAYEGQSAFQHILQTPPHCILLDIRFQRGDDGLTFLRRLRAFRHDNFDLEAQVRKIPVIVLTGAGENMKGLFELEGISDYIQKPYDSGLLKQTVRRILGVV